MRGTITSAGPAVVAGSASQRCRSEWLDRIGLRGEQREQPGVDEEFLTSRLLVAEQAGRDESLQVARCRLPPGDSSLDHVRDPAVRLLEHEIDQLPAVELWCRGPDVFDGFNGPGGGHARAGRAVVRPSVRRHPRPPVAALPCPSGSMHSGKIASVAIPKGPRLYRRYQLCPGCTGYT